MPFQIIDATGNVKTARTVTGGALLAAQNTFSNTSGQIIQGPLDLTGASAGQIKFPASQNASSDVNTLDDYEEGTWTPVIGGSTSESGQSYSIQIGAYVKIGKLVYYSYRVVLATAGTITGSFVKLKGLPFTSENISNQYAASIVGNWGNLATNWISVCGYHAPNDTSFFLAGRTIAGVTQIELAPADIANTSTFIGGGMYRAST